MNSLSNLEPFENIHATVPVYILCVSFFCVPSAHNLSHINLGKWPCLLDETLAERALGGKSIRFPVDSYRIASKYTGGYAYSHETRAQVFSEHIDTVVVDRTRHALVSC